MKSAMALWTVKLGAAFVCAALTVLAPAWLVPGVTGSAAAQEEDTKSAATADPAPYAALQACSAGMELKAGEGCHVNGSGTSFVAGRGSGCIVLYDPSLLAVCHAAVTDSSAVLSAVKKEDGSWRIEEIAETPGSCGELTGLHEAVRLGTADWVACLAAAGSDVNARDERGDTPLHIAAAKGSVELTQVLIAAGADAGRLSREESPVPIGLTELNQILAAAGSEATLQEGAFVAKAGQGVTPLQTAVESGALALVRMLVVASMATPGPATESEGKAEPEAEATPTAEPAKSNSALSQPGWMEGTLLHDAIEEGDEELVRMLVEAGADVDVAGWMEETPLHAAIEKGNVEIVRILVEAGADVNKPGWMGQTPLALAVEEGNAEIMEILLSATPASTGDSSALSQPGWMEETLLHDAIEEEDEELVRMLVEAGADVDMAGWMDETPLHAAIEKGNVEIVRILVEAGADVNKPGWMGQTPLTLAVEEGNAEILGILLSATTEGEAEASAATEEGEAVISEYDRLIRQQPDNARAWALRGVAYFGLERYEEAMADFDEAIRLLPGDGEVYFLRGQAHYELDRYEKAIVDFATALALAKAAGDNDLVADIEEALEEAVSNR